MKIFQIGKSAQRHILGSDFTQTDHYLAQEYLVGLEKYGISLHVNLSIQKYEGCHCPPPPGIVGICEMFAWTVEIIVYELR